MTTYAAIVEKPGPALEVAGSDARSFDDIKETGKTYWPFTASKTADDQPSKKIDSPVRGTDGNGSQGEALMLTTLFVGLAQLWRNGWRGDESVKRNIRAEFISGRPPNLKAASEWAIPVRFRSIQPHPRLHPTQRTIVKAN
jgi:hypothetical protein